IKASFRGIDMIVEQGMNVKIVLFPDGEDPDSYARKHHPAEVETFVSKNAINFILFKTKLLLEETNNDPIKKAALIKEIVLTISLIPDGITRSLYVKECSTTMMVSEQVLMNELNKKLRARINKDTLPQKESEQLPLAEITAELQSPLDFDSAEYQEKEIIRLLLLFSHQTVTIAEGISVLVADFIVHEILSDELGFENSLFNRIFSAYTAGLENNAIPDHAWFLENPDTEISKTAVNLVFSPYQLSLNWLKNNIQVETEETRLKMHIEHSILAFKSKKIEKMITGIQQKLSSAVSAQEQNALMKTLLELKEQSIRINNRGLGRIVIR
ncbi:MAG: hypothetical protein WCI71_03340, partial [Bacteroidota bacterium]